jgi:hypothetical protein
MLSPRSWFADNFYSSTTSQKSPLLIITQNQCFVRHDRDTSSVEARVCDMQQLEHVRSSLAPRGQAAGRLASTRQLRFFAAIWPTRPKTFLDVTGFNRMNHQSSLFTTTSSLKNMQSILRTRYHYWLTVSYVHFQSLGFDFPKPPRGNYTAFTNYLFVSRLSRPRKKDEKVSFNYGPISRLFVRFDTLRNKK